jgi:hypothetical protein
MSRLPSRKVKAHKSYGKYIQQLTDGRNIVLVNDVPAALNLKRFINTNVQGGKLVIEPLFHNSWGLTWRGSRPRLVRETVNDLFFDFGDIPEWP